MIHPERTLDTVYQNYLIQQLSGIGGYESFSEHLGTEQAQSLGNYERLSFESGLFKSRSDVYNYSFENKIYWGSKAHGKLQSIDFLDVNSFSNIKEVWSSLNSKYETYVNFSVISRDEGGQKSVGYLPMYQNGEVIGGSGITFATGFDLGQHSVNEIKKMGFLKTLEDKLLPFAGIKKNEAKKLLPLAQQTILTREEMMRIDFEVKGAHLKSAIESWNASRLKSTPAFKDLSSAQQTVLFARTFHQGPNMPKLPISQKFYTAALNNDWEKAEHYLRNYNVAKDWYKDRVSREADLLRRERYLK